MAPWNVMKTHVSCQGIHAKPDRYGPIVRKGISPSDVRTFIHDDDWNLAVVFCALVFSGRRSIHPRRLPVWLSVGTHINIQGWIARS